MQNLTIVIQKSAAAFSLIAIVCVAACSKQPPPSLRTQNQQPVTAAARPPAPVVISIGQEAFNQAQSTFATKYALCASDAYAEDGILPYRIYHQWRKWHIDMEPQPITQADNLNNVEWHGVAYFRASLARQKRVSDSQWDDWMQFKEVAQYPGDFIPYIDRTYMVKKHGKWTAERPNANGDITARDRNPSMPCKQWWRLSE